MHGDKPEDKIASLTDHRGKNTHRPTDVSIEESTLGELLMHMRKVRQAVPVNTRLKAELRARLAKMAEEKTGVPVTTAKETPARRKMRPVWMVYWWLLPVLLLLLAGLGFYRFALAPKTLTAGPVNEISRLWLEDSPLAFACAPDNRGYLVVRGGALILLDRYGKQSGTIKPAAGQFYDSPALTRTGDQLALVSGNAGGEAEIILTPMPAVSLEPQAVPRVKTALAKAKVLLKVGKGEKPSGLAWSPDGKTLAYSLNQPGGKDEIYLLTAGEKPVSLGTGKHPAWSPDGSQLVVERKTKCGSELWLVDTGSGNARRLVAGQRPAWSPQGYLAFVRVKTTERVLTYNADGSPLFTVRQQQDEIRTIDLKQTKEKVLSTDRLLLASNNGPGGAELNWLRQLTMKGIREPRTLLLNPLDNYQNLHFSPDGKSLLVARRDGGTVSLVQVDLQEKTSGRGEEK